MQKLSDDVIAARMVELRNLRTLHTAARQREKRKDARILELEAIVVTQQAQLDKQAIQIAELQQMVFGRKKRPPMGGTPVPPNELFGTTTKQPRTKDSYRRPIPPASAITDEAAVPLPEACSHCGSDEGFAQDAVTTHERFVEDIPLPELTPDYQAHLVTKYVISRGVCTRCGTPTTGNNTDLGGAEVSLGPNVRLLVSHLIAGVGLSYAQVANLLLSLYGLTVSDGEIARLLQKQHQIWLPAYNRLKADIRAAPVVHGDETPWPIQQLQGAGYAWNLCDASSSKVCFALEQSRGAVYAQGLFGQGTDQPFDGVRVTDDYCAYRNDDLPGQQQLCWVHLYRMIRDVRHNANLPKEQLPSVTQWYEQFAAIYQDLRLYLCEPYDEVVRTTQATELWRRVQTLAKQPVPAYGEPDKLRKLKAQLLRTYPKSK